MKVYSSEARQRVALVGRGAAGRRRPRGRLDRPRRPPRHRRAAGHLARAVLPDLRQHDLGRRVGDPAQHHRRARPRPPPWLRRPDRPSPAPRCRGPPMPNRRASARPTATRRGPGPRWSREAAARAAVLDELGVAGRHVGVLLENVPEFVFLLGARRAQRRRGRRHQPDPPRRRAGPRHPPHRLRPRAHRRRPGRRCSTGSTSARPRCSSSTTRTGPTGCRPTVAPRCRARGAPGTRRPVPPASSPRAPPARRRPCR